MNKVFNSIGHFFATLLGLAQKGAQTVENIASNPVVLTVAALIGGGTVDSAIQAIAGSVVAACIADENALTALGANGTLDAQAIASTKAIITTVKATLPPGTTIQVAKPAPADDSSTVSVLN